MHTYSLNWSYYNYTVRRFSENHACIGFEKFKVNTYTRSDRVRKTTTVYEGYN